MNTTLGIFMLNISKKSRKKLYGLLVENIEDKSKKNPNTIFPIKIYQKFKQKINNIYGGENVYNGQNTDNIANSMPIIPNKHNTKQNLPKIRKAKITISYHKSLVNKKYYGSKTRNKEPKNKYYECIKKNYKHSRLKKNKKEF